MSLLEHCAAMSMDLGSSFDLPAFSPPPNPRLRPGFLLELVGRQGSRLRGRQGLGDRPALSALVYALSRQEGLDLDERRQLALLRAALPKALLALDAPAAELADVRRRLEAAADAADLVAELGRSAARPDCPASAAAGLRQGLALVADLERRRRSAGEAWPLQVEGPALARALAWGALRGAVTQGASAEAVACVAALRVLVERLGEAPPNDEA